MPLYINQIYDQKAVALNVTVNRVILQLPPPPPHVANNAYTY
jgi:hypothetical protein